MIYKKDLAANSNSRCSREIKTNSQHPDLQTAGFLKRIVREIRAKLTKKVIDQTDIGYQNDLYQRPIYICIISLYLGGTEKQIAEVWDFLQSRGWKNIHLVLSRPLYNLLSKIPYLQAIQENNSSLIILECNRLISFLKPLISLALRAKRKSNFHYPLQGIFMIHKLLGHEVIISYNANNFFSDYTGGIRRKVLFFLRALNASKIDVLNPENLEKFKKITFIKDKIVLNPGSVVNLSHYRSHSDKRNWIVFCGRFAEKDPKNVIKFVNSIPCICRALKKSGLKDVKFFILGYGPLESQLKNRLKDDCYKEIDITLRFEISPSEIMQYSKVFVSLQKSSNYPSKSLLEALACGNLPVVTDVGESRLIADDSFSKFVSEHFNPEELAQAILDILLMKEDEFLERTHQARKFLERRFEVSDQEKYYLKLYGLVP